MNLIYNTLFNFIDIKNAKHLMLLLCFFITSITMCCLLNKNVEYNEKLFIGIWMISMVILMVLFTLLLNKYHVYSHCLFWIFYIISIFFIKSYHGKITLLLLSLSILTSWYYYKSLGRSGCPLKELYDSSSTNPLKKLSLINNVIYIYTGYLFIDIFYGPLKIQRFKN